MAARVFRIVGVAGVLACLFHLSRQASVARGHEEVPGMLICIGVLSFLFSLRALLAEAVHAGETNLQKDMFWGIGIGGAMTILVRL